MTTRHERQLRTILFPNGVGPGGTNVNEVAAQDKPPAQTAPAATVPSVAAVPAAVVEHRVPQQPAPAQAVNVSRKSLPNTIRFHPRAWMKLMFFQHNGNTEIAGFGISDATDFLYIQEFRSLKQQCSTATVEFDDDAIADHSMDMAELGLKPAQFLRVWLHTHPMESPHPSGTDEETFSRVFGGCDWSVMFIIGCSGKTYVRLRYQVGAGWYETKQLGVEVDWAAMPKFVNRETDVVSNHVAGWKAEFTANVHRLVYQAPRYQQYQNYSGPVYRGANVYQGGSTIVNGAAVQTPTVARQRDPAPAAGPITVDGWRNTDDAEAPAGTFASWAKTHTLTDLLKLAGSGGKDIIVPDAAEAPAPVTNAGATPTAGHAVDNVPQDFN